jgi:putative DNA primase/helicase
MVDPRLLGPKGGFEFVAQEVAAIVMDEGHYITNRANDLVYRYAGGVYRPDGEPFIRARTQELLGDQTRTHYVNEVVNFVRRATYVGPEEFNTPPPHLINLANGIYDLSRGKLMPHTPDLIFVNQVPIRYRPRAKCPRIERFLHEVMPAADVQNFIEWAGYCLYRRYPYHKALLLVGDGANGKTTALNLLRRFLGEENVSSVTLQELSTDRFAGADLFGKLANIAGDLPYKELQNTARFKSLTGEDRLRVQFKYRPAFDLNSYAKLAFATNRVPPTVDDTQAFFRRWLIINFPYRFEGKRCDPKILEKITTPKELSGFLNLALKGLRQLLKRGGFARTESAEEVAKFWKKMSDPVSAFVNNMVEITGKRSDTIFRQDAYNLFVKFCREHEIPTLGRNTFYDRFLATAPVSTKEASSRGRRGRVWVGVRIRGQPIQARLGEEGGLLDAILLRHETRTRGHWRRSAKPGKNCVSLIIKN